MGELDITDLIVTPAAGLVIAFEPAAAQPLSYRVTADDGTAPVSVETSGSPARMTGLRYGSDLTVTVTAQYADPLDNVSSAPSTVTVQSESCHAEMIRQRVWDILYDAGLALDGRTVTVLHDGYFRPRTARREPLTARYPVIELGLPRLRASSPHTSVTTLDRYEMDIRLIDAVHDEEAALARLSYLAQGVRTRVNGQAWLGLSRAGVQWRGDWQIDRELTRFRDNLKGLRLVYSVGVVTATEHNVLH